MKVDLDELERKASAATRADRFTSTAYHVREHAELSRVVLALIARIGELEICALAAAEIAETVAGQAGLGVHAANISEIRTTVEKGAVLP